MILAAASLVSIVGNIALSVLSVSLCLSFWRLVIGPSLLDRVVALDLAATLLVGALVLHGIAATEPVSLRVATVLALLNFLGTVGFATYVSKKSGE